MSAIYIPPSHCNTLHHSGEAHPLLPSQINNCGDFKTILPPKLARPTPPKHFSGDLSAWALSANLTEAWRVSRVYSCFSIFHKTSSPIDMAFTNPCLLVDVQEAICLPSSLSDHCSLALVLRTCAWRSGSLWCLCAQWVYHPDIVEKTPNIIEDYRGSNNGSSSPDIVWDAFKAYSI